MAKRGRAPLTTSGRSSTSPVHSSKHWGSLDECNRSRLAYAGPVVVEALVSFGEAGSMSGPCARR